MASPAALKEKPTLDSRQRVAYDAARALNIPAVTPFAMSVPMTVASASASSSYTANALRELP